MLEKVKSLLGITGTFQNSTIQEYIDEVKQFMLDGGVDESIVNSLSSAGTIARGVADLWNYGSGDGKLSPYFIQRVTQLAYKSVGETPEAIAELDRRVTSLEGRVDEHDDLFDTLGGKYDD